MVIENMAAEHYSRFDISGKDSFIKIIVTAALILIANIIKFSLQDYIGYGTPFLVYFGLVMLCGRFIGFWHAIASLFICGIIAAVFFMLPAEDFTVGFVVKLIIYAIEGVFIASLTTAFRKNLNTLKQSSNNFKLLISKSQDGLARISKEGKILYISPSIEIITGFTGETLRQKGFDIFPSEEDRLEVATNFLKVIAEPGQSVTFVHRYKNKDNESKWMETIFTNHIQVKGVNAVIANFRDVTERVEADIQKNDFMGIAAHEIKNPLTVVKLNADLQEIAMDSNNYDQARKFNTIIQDNTKKIIHLLEELMNFSGFESALLHLDITECRINTILDKTLFTFSAAYNNEVKIKGDTSMIVNVDRSRIEQVMINLLSNAAKYSPVNSTITIECSVKDSNAFISIIDTGIGIPQKELGLLFNKFHRVHRTHNKTKGYGLGLYICSEIIKAHNGKIGVESTDGEGSVFWFSLPLHI